ncbi:MAG: CHASE domain-containing protein [Hyphomicrobiales bacterium]|nr:CHASE domain-containing protein [Hyphomicrobiales bacterium]
MVRLGFIIALLALIGAGLSGFAAYRVHDQELAIENIALARGVDIHASLVQERLTERELLARIAAGLFRTPTVMKANMLKPLRTSIYAFKTDFVLAGWIARLQPSELDTAAADLAEAGFTHPTIRNFDDTPLDAAQRGEPLDVLMDLEPRNTLTESFAGRALNRSRSMGPTIARANEKGRPVASDPTPLQRDDGPLGVVLVAPVVPEGSDTAVGFVSFSYELGTLMLTNDEMSLFSVALRDPRVPDGEIVADNDGRVQARGLVANRPPLAILRTVSFGGRDWSLGYYPKIDTEVRARRMAILVGGIGLALTVLICGMLGYVSYSNIRLRREVDTRIGFERRLTAVIDELNHRVKNILAVIQSIVTRTLRHGTDMDDARDLLIGRIHAMSHVVSLLSESQWRGVPMRGLFEPRAIPHADRIVTQGPDITVSARAAQSLALLFFELASHSDEGLSLVGKHPNIVAHWEVNGGEGDGRFIFRWEEFNTSEATRRPDSDFGIVLLERVAPEALGGTAKRYFTDVSYVYELSAPMETVIDLTERDRTDSLARPIR